MTTAPKAEVLRPIPCALMRGGTSKAFFFAPEHLPADRAARDRVLLSALGSPDVRQIDGVGGAHPLTSKVAIVGRPTRPDADVDYLFLQVAVDKPEVGDSQNCGNILAAVGPWAIEQRLVGGTDPETMVRVHMVNTQSLAVAHVRTPDGSVEYEGSARIDGVPGTAAPVMLDFLDVAGSSCGALLPTGSATDRVDGIAVTCIDNGMPVVILNAADLGKTGAETPAELDGDSELRRRVESLRLKLGPRMHLGDVCSKTVPKMCLVSAPMAGGALNTRTFIPHRVHEAIGVFGAVSVATACALRGSVAQRVARCEAMVGNFELDIEHPSGFFTVLLEVGSTSGGPVIKRSALLRTARKLMQGDVYVPQCVWSG